MLPPTRIFQGGMKNHTQELRGSWGRIRCDKMGNCDEKRKIIDCLKYRNKRIAAQYLRMNRRNPACELKKERDLLFFNEIKKFAKGLYHYLWLGFLGFADCMSSAGRIIFDGKHRFQVTLVANC